MGVNSFDKQVNNNIDDPVGDDRKSSKTINANDSIYEAVALKAA